MATIQKRARGRYRVMIRRKGYPERTATFTTRTDAEAWAREIEGDMDAGRPVATQVDAKTTLKEALERYQREITAGKRGAGPERVRIRQWLAEPIANRPLASIRGADLADYRDARLRGVTVAELRKAREADEDLDDLTPTRRPVKPNSVRLELAVISNLYTIARTEWKMEGLANPVQSIRRPKPGKPRRRRFEGDEEQLLLEKADPIMRALITFAVETCMRRGEIASLERSQIDRKRSVAHLDITKNGDERDVPLSPRALAAIDALPAQLKGPVFGVTADWISHAFIDLCKACGIVGLHFHDLRREGVSRLIERGWNLEQVRAVSGHKTLQMLTIYSRLSAEDLARKLG